MSSRWWMLPLILLAFFLGLRMLNADILWFDESKTVFYTGARHFGPVSVSEIWNNLAENNPWQSPGYFIALSLWGKLAGWSDFSSRYLSLLIGILALAMLYRMACDLLNSRVGLYAAAILVGSSFYIHYLHEMRPYTLYILMTCLSVWAYWRIISKDSPRWYLYFALFLGLAGLAYTHALALLTAFGIGAYHLLFAPKNRVWLNATGVMVLSAIAFLPWLQVVLKVIGLATEDNIRQDVTLYGFEIIDALLRAFSNGLGVVLLLLLLGFAVWDRRKSVGLVTVWLIVAVGFAFGISYIVPAFIHARYLMSVWPALAFLMAVGLVKVEEKGFPAVAILAVWLIVGGTTSLNTVFFESLSNSRYNIPREGFMQMVDILENHSREGDMLVLHTAPPTEEWDSDDIFDYYFYDIAADYTHMELIRPFPNHFTDAAYEEAVAEELGTVPIIWTAIVPEQVYSRRRLAFFEQLERTHALCQQVLDRPDMDLRLYAQSNEHIVASFAENAVQAQALWDIPATASDTLDILLGIERDPDLPPDTYSIGLHLYSSAGQLVTQADYGLSNNPFSCTWTKLSVDNLSADDYILQMIVYNWQTGERLLSDEADFSEIGIIQVD